MRRWRDARGQGSTEYVALVALVAIALALAAGLTSGGVGGQVLAGLQRGVCRVALADCPRPERPRADLAACQLERTVRSEELTTTLAILHLGTRGTLSIVRLSDGRVTVTLAHGSALGAAAGLGARLRVGRRALGRDAAARVEARWTSGRSWTFPDERTARRFAATYGRKATIGGQLLDGVRSRCSVLCDALGWRPHPELPPPDEEYAEGGPAALLTSTLGVRADADASALLGRRLRRDGERTWYLQLGAVATAALELSGGELIAEARPSAVLAYTADRDGRPRALVVTTAGVLHAGAVADGALGAGRGSLAAGLGGLVELEATLDLRVAANRAAVAGVLEALTSPALLPRLPERASRLGSRIAGHAQLDRRLYAVARTETGIGAGVALGARLDGGVERASEGLRLVGAETRLPGLPFLPRDDCRAGASESRRTRH
jgi:hypothetical protein